jgi:U3 small nucleolar RNA-associated protein 10
MVVKLTESAFKPLFRRLHDWAFLGEIGWCVVLISIVYSNLCEFLDPERQITFCHLYIHLLDFFKVIHNASCLIAQLCNILASGFDGTLRLHTSCNPSAVLWIPSSQTTITSRYGHQSSTYSHEHSVTTKMVLALHKISYCWVVIHSCILGFWRDDKLRQLLTGLTNQVEIGSRSDSVEKKQLQDCLIAFLDIITDDTLVKAVNLNILMHTRSESLQTRIFALTCSEVMWRSHGGKLLGDFVVLEHFMYIMLKSELFSL